MCAYSYNHKTSQLNCAIIYVQRARQTTKHICFKMNSVKCKLTLWRALCASRVTHSHSQRRERAHRSRTINNAQNSKYKYQLNEYILLSYQLSLHVINVYSVRTLRCVCVCSRSRPVGGTIDCICMYVCVCVCVRRF